MKMHYKLHLRYFQLSNQVIDQSSLRVHQYILNQGCRMEANSILILTYQKKANHKMEMKKKNNKKKRKKKNKSP